MVIVAWLHERCPVWGGWPTRHSPDDNNNNSTTTNDKIDDNDNDDNATKHNDN